MERPSKEGAPAQQAVLACTLTHPNLVRGYRYAMRPKRSPSAGAALDGCLQSVAGPKPYTLNPQHAYSPKEWPACTLTGLNLVRGLGPGAALDGCLCSVAGLIVSQS